MTYWSQLLFHVLIFAEANDILAPASLPCPDPMVTEGDGAEVVPTAEHEADAQDSARGWRFADARYVFRNTSGAVRFMADRRLGTPTTRCPSTPHTGAAKSKET